MLERRRIFGEPRPDQTQAERMHSLWNLLPAVIAGYFDDTMTGGIPDLVEQITTAVFYLIIKLGIDAQFMKFERGTADRQHFLYSGTELHLEPAKRSWTRSPNQDHVMILGKEAVLDTFIRRDSADRLSYVAGLWTGCRTIEQKGVALGKCDSNSRQIVLTFNRTAGQEPGQSVNLRKTRLPLVPPNPNEFEIATFTSTSRAVIGT